jgi:SAM-dependent methyltransferase
MMTTPSTTPPAGARPHEFDRFAADYAAATRPWNRIAGDSTEYFAEARLRWLAGILRERGVRVRSIMDFGCGTGTATPWLYDVLGAEQVIGVDPSVRSLDTARQKFAARGARFMLPEEYEPRAELDLIYANGVFHHIPPRQRDASAAYVRDALRPGGLLAVWENNPMNPLVALAMSVASIDATAQPMISRETMRLFVTNGFEHVRTDFMFLFPGLFRPLRRFEPHFRGLPFGAQYQVLCRKPAPAGIMAADDDRTQE